MSYVWPIEFCALRQSRTPQARLITGGTAWNGQVQVVRTDGGPLWRVTFDGIVLNTVALQRAWEAWEGLLDGGVQTVVVRYRDGLQPGARPSWDDYGVDPDDVVYAQQSAPIAATFGAAAALRATTVTLTGGTGADAVLTGHFSVLHADPVGPRMYRILRALGDDVYLITPPLRAAVAEDTAADFNSVACAMRLAGAEEMTSQSLRQRLRSGLKPTFVEAF